MSYFFFYYKFIFLNFFLFFFGNFSLFSNVVKNDIAVSGLHSIETLSEYRNYISSLGNLKLALEKNTNDINYLKNNKLETETEFKLEELRKEQDILSDLLKIKNEIEQYIKKYEKIIDVFIQDSLLAEKQIVPRKVNFDWLKSISLKIGRAQEEILSIEKSLEESYQEEKLRKESYEKTLGVLAKIEKKNYKNKKHFNEKVLNLQKKLALGLLKSKEIEVKIAEAKLFILKESLRNFKNVLSKGKSRIFISQRYMNRFFSEMKSKEDRLKEERDLVYKQYELIDSQIRAKVKDSILLEDFFKSDFFEQFYLQDKLKEYCDLVLLFVEKEQFKIKGESITTNLFALNYDKSLATGWFFISFDSVETRDLQQVIDSFDFTIIDFLIDEKIKCIKNLNNIVGLYKNIINILKKNNNICNSAGGFNSMIDFLEEKYDFFVNLINISTGDFDLLNNIKYESSILKEELSLKKFWSRSKYSIALDQLYDFFPHVKNFFKEMYLGFGGFVGQFWDLIALKNSVSKINLIYVLIAVVVALSFGFITNSLIVYGRRSIYKHAYKHHLIARVGLLFDFLAHYGLLLAIWFYVYLVLKLKLINFNYFTSLYYFFSIFFLSYIYYEFVEWLNEINKKKMYTLISQSYVNRFLLVISIFGYSNIFLYFFRESFLIVIQNSIVPVMIRAFQFILIQVCLIFLLKKEQIIYVLPESSAFFNFFKLIINKYYSIVLTFVITLIIMSNPYVGYGAQVLYFLTRFFLTLVFVPLVYKIFNYIRSLILNSFVTSYDVDHVDKIGSARWAYTFFIFLAYFLMIFCYCFFAYFIWNFAFNFNKIYEVVNYNFLSNQFIVSDKGLAFFSLLTIVKVIFFVLAGYVFSAIINFFVLKEIFHPIIIGSLLQNTISTLFKYLVVFVAFIIGLYSVGLQALVTKLAFVIGFFGFAIKEPFADFISYFIILVQRPIKIGDLIKIYMASGPEENNIIGTVRQITPRVTFIRQRNSQIVIVPNSIIVSKMICNWTLQRTGFVATEDIFLVVDFSCDIEYVKSLLCKIMEQSSLILKNPAPIIWCKNFNSSGYEFLVRGFIPLEIATEQWEVASQLRIAIIKKFKQEKISISFPSSKIFIENSSCDNFDKNNKSNENVINKK